MYNLLIVDDEKIIRDGIVELLSMEESLELNIFSASSAIEAEQILETRKVDIVLTDIQMPRMNGIQLMEVILERWSHCKIIFLTGYSEFEYVYKVHKHARYVLKAEEDEKIIEAITEAINEIESDFVVENMVLNSDRIIKKQKKWESVNLFNDLFNGLIQPGSINQTLLDQLGIDIDLSQTIYYIVLRHDFIMKETYSEQLEAMESFQALVEKYFYDSMKGILIEYSKNVMILLMQPIRLVSNNRNSVLLKGNSELFQKACRKNFDIAVSIAIGNKPLVLNEILAGFQFIKAKLLTSDEEQLIFIDLNNASIVDDEALVERQKNNIKSRLDLLDYYFDNVDQEHVTGLIRETMELCIHQESMHDLFAVEVYSDIAVKLIKYINQFRLSQEICFRINVYNLYNVTLHKSWKEAFEYLLHITAFIFELKFANQERQNVDVVDQVKEYIQNHLSEDTSLDVLADLVGLSPEYLLRLFKKSENCTILHYINELKIIKAKNMIADHSVQIKEIAAQLGFTSSGYFGRFFKSKTGFSPQSYRDQNESR